MTPNTSCLSDAELLKGLLDESPAAIDFKDGEGRYLRVSAACARLLRVRDPSEAIGRTAADFVSDRAAEQARLDEETVMRTGRSVVDIERREEDAEGRIRWTLISRHPLYDASGEIVGTVGTARDITRRKLADEALQQVNARLTRVITTQRELAARALDLDAVTALVAERALELTGAHGAAVHILDGEELVTRAGSGDAARTTGRRRRAEETLDNAALRTGRAVLVRDTKTDHRARGIPNRAAAVVCAPFFHGDTPTGTVELMRSQPGFDANDRNTTALLAAMLSSALSQAAEYTAKRAQVEALAHFEATVRGAPIGIATVTADGAIVAANPVLQELLGSTAEELERIHFGELFADESDDPLAALLAGERVRGERRLLKRDGSPLWVDVSLALVGDARFAVAMIQDISARKQAEAERDRMEAELRLAQKLEAVGQLAAGIAHEINTPIQFVRDAVRFLEDAFADLGELGDAYERFCELAAPGVGPEPLASVADAREQADLDYLRERVPAAIERSLGGLERIAEIVAAMRAFAEPPAIAGAVDLNASLRNTLVVATHEYAAVADVQTELADLPPVAVDPSEINHVLLNLVVNAAHAIAEVVGDSGERGRIQAITRVDGRDVVLTIADTGCGMPDDVAARAFDPFFTTKDVGAGTGQGLTVARSIVERHGGKLTFETEPGRSSAFHVRLPVAA